LGNGSGEGDGAASRYSFTLLNNMPLTHGRLITVLLLFKIFRCAPLLSSPLVRR
jgi:hypothetical protein